jgi:hypothetical protein
MADSEKVVRLRDAVSGVVVQASEETAAGLYGFEAEKAPAKKAASSKSEK